MPPSDSIILDLPGFKIIDVTGKSYLVIKVQHLVKSACPHCASTRLRTKDTFIRRIRHIIMGQRPTWLEVKAHKYQCRNCRSYFNTRFTGIRPRKRATEPSRVELSRLHHKGWTQKDLSKDMRLGSATVERWYQENFELQNRQYLNAHCPRVLGIDEHFFTRKDGYATAIANLASNRVFDVVLGRSELSLRSYMKQLIGRDRVRVVVMDFSETYRSIAKKYFPSALIVGDRFHAVRMVNHHFIKTWADLDPVGRKHRGLVSLMRRHPDHFKSGQKERLYEYLQKVPGLLPVYMIWQDLLRLLRMKGCNQGSCRAIIPEFLYIIEELRKTKFTHLQVLGETLNNWKEEIARMFRFSKTNSITEGLHNKMEMISRRAYGFRNFENYRLRVRVLCG